MPIGERIWHLNQLHKAVMSNRAVVSKTTPWLHRSKPAVVIFNMQGAVIYKLINAGLYVYEKEKISANSKEAKRKENRTEKNDTRKEI